MNYKMCKRKNIFTLVLKFFTVFFSFVYDRTRFFGRDPLLPYIFIIQTSLMFPPPSFVIHFTSLSRSYVENA